MLCPHFKPSITESYGSQPGISAPGKYPKSCFFHWSTVAAHILEQKQEMLHSPKHRLITVVPTRWNSSYEMIERYLEQQTSVCSALTERALKNKEISQSD